MTSVAAESTSASFAKVTAPPRQVNSAMPAAMPNAATRILTAITRASDSPLTESAATAFAATSPRLAGPQRSNSTQNNSNQPPIPRGPSLRLSVMGGNQDT